MRARTATQAHREGAQAAANGTFECPYRGRLALAWRDGWAEEDHRQRLREAQ